MNAYRPQSLNEALEIIEREECIVFAGGTDIMVKKKQWSGVEPGFEKPLVFIEELVEIKSIKKHKKNLIIGAACTFTEMIESPDIPEYMKQVFHEMASPAIRNIATIGGNICNSSPAGDSLPLLYAADALLVLESVKKRREVPIEEFILGPGRNIRERDEILTEIKIPMIEFDSFYYKKVGTRRATALSKLSFAGFYVKNNDRIRDMRIAFGAVGPTVVRDKNIEDKIVKMNRDTGMIDLKKIKEMYRGIIKPIDDQRSTALYRKEVCLRLLNDFLS